jgi:hypothetical protein
VLTSRAVRLDEYCDLAIFGSEDAFSTLGRGIDRQRRVGIKGVCDVRSSTCRNNSGVLSSDSCMPNSSKTIPCYVVAMLELKMEFSTFCLPSTAQKNIVSTRSSSKTSAHEQSAPKPAPLLNSPVPTIVSVFITIFVLITTIIITTIITRVLSLAVPYFSRSPTHIRVTSAHVYLDTLLPSLHTLRFLALQGELKYRRM